MKKILTFGASNSKTSINKTLASFASNQLDNAEVVLVDLNYYESPLYSVDREKASGVHENALRFSGLIKACDAIVISLAEYNGLYTSAFKNLWDWLSRIPTEKPYNIWDDKPMFLLSTSPSPRPMNNVMKISKELFPNFGAEIVADFHLPSFNRFFKNGEIIEAKYKVLFDQQRKLFQEHLDKV